ncbi:MAG: MerR family transcriptional regulator [Desulfatiglandales bacterium]
MGQKKYTIEDLCEFTGYTRRTIRYYIHEGLLDPPAGRGRGGFYFDSHLKRLEEIRSFQEKGLKLTAILEALKKGRTPELSGLRELWVKYRVDEGIEIHISRDLEEKKRREIAEIIRLTRSILGSEGGENE